PRVLLPFPTRRTSDLLPGCVVAARADPERPWTATRRDRVRRDRPDVCRTRDPRIRPQVPPLIRFGSPFRRPTESSVRADAAETTDRKSTRLNSSHEWI